MRLYFNYISTLSSSNKSTKTGRILFSGGTVGNRVHPDLGSERKVIRLKTSLESAPT